MKNSISHTLHLPSLMNITAFPKSRIVWCAFFHFFLYISYVLYFTWSCMYMLL